MIIQIEKDTNLYLKKEKQYKRFFGGVPTLPIKDETTIFLRTQMFDIGKSVQEKLIITLLIFVTLMFQNPITPYFKGVLGKLQIFDFIYPIIIAFFLKIILKNILNKFNYFLIISIFIFISSSIITANFSFKHLIFIYLFSILLTTSCIRLTKQQTKKVLDYFIFLFLSF